MKKKLKHVIRDYNQHVVNNTPVTIMTVMAWLGAQTLIQEAMKRYFPEYEPWIVGALELFVATIGIWYFTRKPSKKPKKKKVILNGVVDKERL